jgi:hypothetical protein
MGGFVKCMKKSPGRRGMCDSVANGRARLVVQVDEQVIAPRLADDLGAVQSVDVVSPVHDLVGADAVGVIPELDKRLSAVAAICLR